MRRFAMAAVAAGAAGLTSMVLVPVQAGTAATRAEPNRTVSTTDPVGDVDSRLDIVLASSRRNGDGTVTLTIRTARTWACGYLRDVVSQPDGTASNFLFWDFDQGEDGTYDMSGSFVCRQGVLGFEIRRGRGYRQTYRASRPDSRSARATFPISELGAFRVHMRAMSRVTGVIGGEAFVDEEDLVSPLRLR